MYAPTIERGHGPGEEVEDPPAPGGPGVVRPSPAGRQEDEGGIERDGRNGCAGAGRRTLYPQRGVGGQEQRREGEDDGEPGGNETDTADQPPESSPQAPGAEGGQLGRRRPGQQVGGRDAVLELGGGEPMVVLDAELAKQGDVGRRPTESDDADAPPLPAILESGTLSLAGSGTIEIGVVGHGSRSECRGCPDRGTPTTGADWRDTTTCGGLCLALGYSPTNAGLMMTR